MVCLEIDAESGDELRCFDAQDSLVADVAGARLSFDFFANPDTYLRVASYAVEPTRVQRLAWEGTRFAPAAPFAR
ncbi:MAG: hypothetical protein U0414_14710 [Polyangiaceae bacterium]